MCLFEQVPRRTRSGFRLDCEGIHLADGVVAGVDSYAQFREKESLELRTQSQEIRLPFPGVVHRGKTLVVKFVADVERELYVVPERIDGRVGLG